MNFCIAEYLRIKSSPNNAICFIKTNFGEAIKYCRLNTGAIVLFEVSIFAGSQNPGGGGYSTNFYTGRPRPEVQPLTLLYTVFHEKGSPFVYLLLTNDTSFTCLV